MLESFSETLSRPPHGGIAQVAPDGRFRTVSPQLAHFLGFTCEELSGKGMDEITYKTDHLRECAQLERLMARGSGKFSLLKRFKHPKRGLIWAEQLVLLMPGADGSPPLFEVHIREPMVSDQSLNDLHRRAFRDPLTGLLNRASISEQIDSAMLAGERLGRGFALLLLDLDGFKQVNDTHGHLAGDAVIQQVGQRLIAAMVERDLAGRLGGDEFVILLRSATDEVGLKRGIKAVLNCFNAPFTLPHGGQTETIALGTSLGMAAFPHDGCTVTGLLTRADHRMYEEKRSRLSA